MELLILIVVYLVAVYTAHGIIKDLGKTDDLIRRIENEQNRQRVSNLTVEPGNRRTFRK